MGLLTERAAKTLSYYLLETNQNIHHWVNRFIQEHPIPRDGNWDDVSGDTFLRTLLSMQMEEASPWGRDQLFHNTSVSDVDPRSIAQRIMEIRTELAKEFIQDLQQVAEENKLLQLETLQASLLSTEDAIADGSAAARQAARSTPSSTATSRSGSPSSSGTSSPGASRGGPRLEAVDPTRTKSKSKKSVIPPTAPTPSNWRLRLEVEAQVHADDVPPAGVPSPIAGPIPDTAMTGLVAPMPPAEPAPTPAPSPSASGAGPAPSAPSSSGPGKAAAGPPPLHPEVAELLPVIRSSPSALTPDVASMLASMAVTASGGLHPDIVDALRSAVASGAKLHPEIAELLRLDVTAVAAPLVPPAAPESPRASSMGSTPRSASPSALSRSKPTAVAGSSGPEAAAAPAASAASQVVEAPQPKPAEEEAPNSIEALQNDTCLHSDDE
ncbi:hypothetical protein HYH03_013171 [Edaphochlamys debaryana]|uniref:Uncharacterized protein n=1 Tax=Edaphochlamys debaryana TaxID=47281 RepID=A0A836BT94_9CHLO|nr:hypothetical protein HYH03_013171 [Edaphochlamys debaryana]|eukprot:KAG2488321.1 hypothetical protein HYH03_013171 [Edaphochlamys debaryana]